MRADFNHDSFADLAAGAPLEDVGSAGTDAGAVSILYGSAAGLTATGRLFTQVGGAVERGDNFGEAAASGDFNHDSFADLAVSAPGENQDAGAISILYGSAGGLTSRGGRLFTQVGGAVEHIDWFGAAVARATSTRTASPTWGLALPGRPSAPWISPARSACCTARPAG